MRNPAVPGFHPDPSVCRVGDDYWLACSTFEYFPGVPIFHSTDAETWELVGHVVTRPGQLAIEGVPTGGGAWAPTIRHHDGLFYLTIADAMGRGGLIFTATDPRGPWSDGTPMVGADGIDHDIAWDADGTCYVTFSGLILTGEAVGTHLGIQQVRMDPTTGRALEEPRSLWAGTGKMFPEAPHLYEVDGTWYLMVAEGGTERGHSVSIARGPSPVGPFEGHPANPIHTHRSTDHPVQNSGHADLVPTDDGWVMVSLGTRPRGATRAFAPMGRETYQTRVHWEDGWPVVEPFALTAGLPRVRVETDLGEPLGLEWITVRDAERGWLRHEGGALVVTADPEAPAAAMDASRPRFVGRRQQHERARIGVVLEAGDGVGGLSVRYDEDHHYDVERDGDVVVARVRLDQVEHLWTAPAPAGPLELWIDAVPTQGGFTSGGMSCDTVRLGFTADGAETEVAVMDGRYLTSDTCASFTGRVWGMYAARGEVAFSAATYEGDDER